MNKWRAVAAAFEVVPLLAELAPTERKPIVYGLDGKPVPDSPVSPHVSEDQAGEVGRLIGEHARKHNCSGMDVFEELDERPGQFNHGENPDGLAYYWNGKPWHQWLRQARNEFFEALESGMRAGEVGL